MLTKSILLGGAMAMALSGAGFAQQSTPNAQTTTTTSHVAHHYRHHRVVASLRAQLRAANEATRDLNLQQLRTAQYEYSQGYAQGYARGAQYAQYSRYEQGAQTPPSDKRAFVPTGYPFYSAARGGGGPPNSRGNGGQDVAR